MAHYTINTDTSPRGRNLKAVRNKLQEVIAGLREESAAMAACASVSNAEIEAVYGLPAGGGAAVRGELDSLLGKLENGGSVGDLKAAITQFLSIVA